MVSLVAQNVKNLPAMWDTRVGSLSQEDPLEEGMATHSRILAWRIPWTEEPGGLQSMGSQRVGQDRASANTRRCLNFHESTHSEINWIEVNACVIICILVEGIVQCILKDAHIFHNLHSADTKFLHLCQKSPFLCH